MSTKPIIEKWYKALEFPSCYDAEFYQALDTIEIPASLTIDEYNTESEASAEHFLAYLYFCEALEKHYAERGIDHTILMDTLADLRRWTDVWSTVKGGLALGELAWLKHHLSGELFRLGSLQFMLQESYLDIEEKALYKGETILEVHIPAKTDFSPVACHAAFARAKRFFATYFPNHEYRFFTCHSWMLDDRLQQVMRPDSNVLAFQSLFDVVHNEDSNDLLRYLFRWDITKETLPDAVPISSTAARVKERVLAGESFQISFGVFEKEKI